MGAEVVDDPQTDSVVDQTLVDDQTIPGYLLESNRDTEPACFRLV